MAKLSRKKRKEIKAKELRREIEREKAGEPYSKKKMRVCYHFIGTGGGFIVGFACPTLVRINDKECMCRNCKKKFSLEFMNEMDRLTRNYANAGCLNALYAREELLSYCNPVRYYYSGPNEICYVDTESIE